jgi:hypothetical protein
MLQNGSSEQLLSPLRFDARLLETKAEVVEYGTQISSIPILQREIPALRLHLPFTWLLLIFVTSSPI